MSTLDATKARGISLALKQCIKELQRDAAKSRANPVISAVLPTLQALKGLSHQEAALSQEELQLLLDNRIPARVMKLATSLLHLALPAKHQGSDQLVVQAATGLSTQARNALRLAVQVLYKLHLQRELQGPQGVAWLQQVVPCMDDGAPGEDGLLPHAMWMRFLHDTAVASFPLVQQAVW